MNAQQQFEQDALMILQALVSGNSEMEQPLIGDSEDAKDNRTMLAETACQLVHALNTVIQVGTWRENL